jgi:hypothetical protein
MENKKNPQQKCQDLPKNIIPLSGRVLAWLFKTNNPKQNEATVNRTLIYKIDTICITFLIVLPKRTYQLFNSNESQ